MSRNDDRNDHPGRSTAASEDTTQARENTRRARENREALADQARRVEASVPAGQRAPRVEQTGSAAAGPRPTEDNTEAVRRTEQVRENRAALEEQARRTESSVPKEIRDRPIGQ
jgi:hypothetical protein